MAWWKPAFSTPTFGIKENPWWRSSRSGLYLAQAGGTTEARELLLKSMGTNNPEETNGAV
jgi:hypothetical protein